MIIQPFTSKSNLDYLQSKLAIGDKKPRCIVKFFYTDSSGIYTGLIFEKTVSVDIDQKIDTPCSEATIKIDNPMGSYSPFYDAAKFPEINLQPFNFKNLFLPNTKVEIWLGYGNNIKKRFTGLIDKVSFAGFPNTMTLRVLSMYKIIQEHILEPPGGSYTYHWWSAGSIMGDLIDRCTGLPVMFEEVMIWDGSRGDYVPYTIESVEFKYGEFLSDSVSSIAKTLNHRIGDNAEGVIYFKEDIYDATWPEDHLYTDWVGLKELSMDIDDQKIRTHVMVFGGSGFNLFRNDYLFNEIAKGRRKVSQIPLWWGDTREKREVAARKFFRDILRKFKTGSFVSTGNPNIKIADLIRLRNVGAGINSKYRVVGIKTSFNTSGVYLDNIEYESCQNLSYVVEERSVVIPKKPVEETFFFESFDTYKTTLNPGFYKTFQSELNPFPFGIQHNEAEGWGVAISNANDPIPITPDNVEVPSDVPEKPLNEEPHPEIIEVWSDGILMEKRLSEPPYTILYKKPS